MKRSESPLSLNGPRLALWGTFDVANYGDLLFPRIFINEMRRRLPSAKIKLYSPLGRLHPMEIDAAFQAEPLGRCSETLKKQIAEGLDLLAVGGGEIIHFQDEAYSSYYGAIPEELRPLKPSDCFIDGLGSELEESCPVVWHAVGVPKDFTGEQAVRVKNSLKTKRYISVRDHTSKARISNTGFKGQIDVVPDSAVLLDRIFPSEVLSARLDYLRKMGWYPPLERPLILQGNGWLDEYVADDMATAANEALDEFPTLPIVLIEMAPCHRDGEFADRLASRLGKPVFRLPRSVALEDIASAISNARLFAGSSLHGHITSLLHGVPRVIVNPNRQTKLEGFAKLIHREADVLRDTSSIGIALRNALGNPTPHTRPLVKRLIREVDEHFDRMAVIADAAWKLKVEKDQPLQAARGRASNIRIGKPGPADRPPSPSTAGSISNPTFVCNICGSPSNLPIKILSREMVSCGTCGSTPRFRAIVSVLSTELYGESLPLSDFPVCPQIRGLGFSDWPGYAAPLADKFGYINTFYDREPRLDVTLPPSEAVQGSFDFIIASDVFEHVAPPVESAFRNALLLLKPGGFFVLTVPYTLEEKTIERFPTLKTYEILFFQENPLLINRAEDGHLEVFDDLKLHEGNGSTIEMRIFSRDGLIENLYRVGFVDIDVVPGDRRMGATWPDPWSLPLVARRPKDRLG